MIRPTILAGEQKGRGGMRTYGSDVRHERSLSRVVEDSIAIFAQDAAEYSFVGLIAGFAACVSTLVLGMIGGAISMALIPPIVIIAAVVAMATVVQAFSAVADNLEPESARAFGAIAPRLPAMVQPFLPVAAVLCVAALALSLAGGYVPSIARSGALFALAVVAVSYALPRSLAIPALVMQRGNVRDAVDGSVALFARRRSKLISGWAICGAPAIIVALLGLAAGFGTLSVALLALVFVGTMPFAAIVMSLLFFDAIATSGSATVTPIRRSAQVDARAAGAGGRQPQMQQRRRW